MKNWVRWAIIGLIVVVIGGLYYYKNIYNKGEPKNLKKNDYIYTSTENINEALPTIMTLSTTTCPACREMETVLRKFAPKYKDKVNVVKIDLNKNPEYGYAFKVSVVPTNIFMKKGKEVFKGETGAMDEKSIKEIFKEMGVSLDD
jgi:thioredoxin 1